MSVMEQKGYELEERIGVGNFSIVNIVHLKDEPNQRFVLKELELKGMKTAEREGAHQEAQLLSDLSHPCIIGCRESFLDEENQTLNIVMEYCSGGDLAKVIDDRKEENEYFHEQDILDYLAQLLLALTHMHDNHILHRDLKAKNVFVTKNNWIKLGDLGIAKVLNSTNEFARTVIGTPYYLSPEICEGRNYDQKSDVWSLGCVLYELCTLSKAFDGKTLPVLVVKILSGKYPPIPDHYSDDLHSLVASMLQLNPAKRPMMAEMLELPCIRKRIKAMGMHEELAAADAAKAQRDASFVAVGEEKSDAGSLTMWMNGVDADMDAMMNDLDNMRSPTPVAAQEKNPFVSPGPKRSAAKNAPARVVRTSSSSKKDPRVKAVPARRAAPASNALSPMQQMMADQRDAAQRKKEFLQNRRKEKREAKNAEDLKIKLHKEKLKAIKNRDPKAKASPAVRRQDSDPSNFKTPPVGKGRAHSHISDVQSPSDRKSSATKRSAATPKNTPTPKITPATKPKGPSSQQKRTDLKKFLKQQRKAVKNSNSEVSVEILEGPKVVRRPEPIPVKKTELADELPPTTELPRSPQPKKEALLVHPKSANQPATAASPTETEEPALSPTDRARLNKRIEETRDACQRALGVELFDKLYNYVKGVQGGQEVDEAKVKSWCANDQQLLFLPHIHRLIFCEERFLKGA